MVHYPTKDYISDINNSDGACDLPIAARYKQIEILYPGSKFIYTVRERHDWMESVTKHFLRRPSSTLGEWGKHNRELIYGSLYADEVDFLAKFDAHDLAVREYFHDKKLLILDISKDDAWEDLADFLNKEPPPKGTPFPFSNKAPGKNPSIDAVYPYIDQPGSWEELRYSVRALEKNFVDLKDIWIVGDKPEWANDRIKIIPRSTGWSKEDRVRNSNYCGSILAAALSDEISETFLCINDDHYLLIPLRASDIVERPIIREDLTVYNQAERATADKNWQLILWETYDKLQKFGLSGYSYENHIPVVVTKKQIASCMALFGYGEGNLSWKTAYFNMYPPSAGRAHLSEQTDLKAGFYGIKYSDEEVDKKIKNAIYLSHNDDGLSEGLKKKIINLFPEPSSFEK